jgi:hypothetical protein
MRGISILGYDVRRTDQPNHRVPNLEFAFYLRPARRLHENLQPVVYEVMEGDIAGCVSHPLGLAWLPTSEWKPGRAYQIRMDPLETSWQTPGNAHLYVELRPTPPSEESCSSLWKRHGRLWALGAVEIGL